jgi:hypothetical protein
MKKNKKLSTQIQTSARVFSEFRRYGIPYIFFSSVDSEYYTELLKIPRNYVEFRIAEFVEFRGISRNSVTFGVTKFRIILILQLQASTVGWGKGEIAQFKGTVLRDF